MHGFIVFKVLEILIRAWGSIFIFIWHFHSVVFCYLCSDEEDEDLDALMYLPVSPEVDEPEEVWQGTGDGAVSFIFSKIIRW